MTVNVGEVMQYTLSDLRTSTYDFRVAANTQIGRGVWSRVVMATLTAALVPPSRFVGIIINSTSVSLSWEPLSGATSYIVTYMHPDERLGREEVMGETVIVRGLSQGSEYTFSIIGVLDGGETTPTTNVTVVLPGGVTPSECVFV